MSLGIGYIPTKTRVGKKVSKQGVRAIDKFTYLLEEGKDDGMG